MLTLGLINAGPILKMTQSTMDRMLQSDFSRYEVLSGLPHGMVVRHALRNALPSVVTIISVLYGYLLGGAVLVEIVFSWGGAGQYAVQGVLNSDIYPVLGFVLFSAIFSLVVYLLVDLIYVAIDPQDRTLTMLDAGRRRRRHAARPQADPPTFDMRGLTVEFPAMTRRRRTPRSATSISRIERGEIFGLVGESGAGKTTLARSLLRLPPEPGRIAAGELVFEGQDI